MSQFEMRRVMSTFQCLATFLEAKQTFPTGVIRAEPTSLPPGQQCLQWFNQNLQGPHQFYTASYKPEPLPEPLPCFGLIILWVIFRNKIWGNQMREKRPCFLLCPDYQIKSQTIPEIDKCHFSSTVHCSFFLPLTGTKRLLIA